MVMQVIDPLDYYGSDILTPTKYRDRIVKYPLSEGLKNYQIPLPLYFTGNISSEEGRKGKIPTRCCFVCSKLPGLKANQFNMPESPFLEDF